MKIQAADVIVFPRDDNFVKVFLFFGIIFVAIREFFERIFRIA